MDDEQKDTQVPVQGDQGQAAGTPAEGGDTPSTEGTTAGDGGVVGETPEEEEEKV